MTDLHPPSISRIGTAESTWLRWTNARGESGRSSLDDEADIGDDRFHGHQSRESSGLERNDAESVPFANQGAEQHIDAYSRQQADDFYHLESVTSHHGTNVPFDEQPANLSRKPVACRYPILNAPEGQDPNDFEPIDDSSLLPPLDFKPFILREWTLIVICAFYLCLIAGVSVLYWFQNNARIFHTRATVSHFTIRILPSIIGSLSTIIFQSVTTNFARIVPYIEMARSNAKSSRGSSGSRTLLAQYFPLPGLDQAFGDRRYDLVVLFVIQIYVNPFVTPLKTTLIHRTSSDDDPNLWTISISSVPALILIFIYSVAFSVVMALSVYLWRRRTGLKWDPVSLADHMMLLQGSNVLEDFSGLEYFQVSRKDDSLLDLKTFLGKSSQFNILRAQQYRLGYWRHKHTKQYWHGIRKWPLPTVESPLDERYDDIYDAPSLTDQSSDAKIWWTSRYLEIRRRPDLCYHTLYFWLSDILATITFFVTAASAAGGLYFILTDRLQTSFTLPVQHFQNASFIVNFVPSFVLGFLNAYWYQIDIWYRQLQPFMGLRTPSPATENLLLGYSCDLPVVITIKALANKHWRLAFTSLMPLVQRIVPIIGGSIFSITPTSQDRFFIGVSLALPFKAVTGILLTYLVLIPIAWPGLDRRLPVKPLCIANLWVLFYDSTLIRKDAFLPRTMNEQRWHMEYRLCLEERRYGFGFYKGRCNAIHIGIDDVYGHSSDEMGFRFVAPLKPPMRWYRTWLKSAWIWSCKKMKIKRQPTFSPEELESQERLYLELQETRTPVGDSSNAEIESLDQSHGGLRERRGPEPLQQSQS